MATPIIVTVGNNCIIYHYDRGYTKRDILDNIVKREGKMIWVDRRPKKEKK